MTPLYKCEYSKLHNCKKYKSDQSEHSKKKRDTMNFLQYLTAFLLPIIMVNCDGDGFIERHKFLNIVRAMYLVFPVKVILAIFTF